MTFSTANCGRQTVEAPGPPCQTASGQGRRVLRTAPGHFREWGAWGGQEEWRTGNVPGWLAAVSVCQGIFAAPGEATYIQGIPEPAEGSCNASDHLRSDVAAGCRRRHPGWGERGPPRSPHPRSGQAGRPLRRRLPDRRLRPLQLRQQRVASGAGAHAIQGREPRSAPDARLAPLFLSRPRRVPRHPSAAATR